MINTTINSLEDYARKIGSEVHYQEIPYPPTPPNNITYHRRHLYFKDDTAIYICYADSKELGPQGVFSGVFIPFDVLISFQMEARKKDVLDKLNPFGGKKKFKSGIPSFDAKVSIKTNDDAIMKRLLQDRSLQNIILYGTEVGEAFIAGINAAGIGFVPELKGKSHFGIFTRQSWIEDAKTIEKLFAEIKSIVKRYR